MALLILHMRYDIMLLELPHNNNDRKPTVEVPQQVKPNKKLNTPVQILDQKYFLLRFPGSSSQLFFHHLQFRHSAERLPQTVT
jgi:hypothetical protein